MMTDERTPGPEPSVKPDQIIATVKALYGDLDDLRGVTPQMVSEELDAPERTIRYHLNGLVQQGCLVDAWDHDHQPRRVFLPRDA
jgi:predicted ArsR family transcriptional regulator